MLAALEREGVRYAVFGAVAVNIHGLPRFTEDLDILTRLGEAFRYEDLETQRMPFEGMLVTVVSPQTLYRMKKDTVRPKDRMDAEALRRKFNLGGN